MKYRHGNKLSNKPPIRIVDRPCGTGKTTSILSSFEGHNKYLVIVPLLTEVDRVLEEACIPFKTPNVDDCDTKTESIRNLLIEGENIVTTHALYSTIAFMGRDGLLDDYHVIIDEVPEVVRDGAFVKPKSYRDVYLRGGYVTEDSETGKVTPSSKWEEDLEALDDVFSKKFYYEAKSGCLHRVDKTFFIWAMPLELLTRNLSLTVYTYLAEGSMLLAYLDKHGLDYHHDRDLEMDIKFRKKAKELITIKTIPQIEKLNLSASGQSRMDKGTKSKVSKALKALRGRSLKYMFIDNIALTSYKSNWYLNGKSGEKRKAVGFSAGTGLFKAHWLPNTTRGTNNYNHVDTMIYLWNQYMNDSLRRWLEMRDQIKANSDYGTSELIQWVYRSRVRKGEPITLYLPSKRMRTLLQSWLNGEDIQKLKEELQVA